MWVHLDGVISLLAVLDVVTKIPFLDEIACQVIGGRLFYLKEADDGTTALWPIDRPKDLKGEVWDMIRNRMAPSDYYRWTKADIIQYLRDHAEVIAPLPDPWAVGPDTSGIETLASLECGVGRHGDAPRLPKAIASGILARHRDPSARVAPLIIIATPSEAPKVLALASVLASGRVYEHGPGHGEIPPGTLAEVWRTPPADPSDLWADVRGDKRTPRPVPVILSDPGQWGAWREFFASHSRRSNPMPAHHAYVASDVTVPTQAQARVLWSGLLAWANPDRLRSATCPRRTSGEVLGNLANALAVLMRSEASSAPALPDLPEALPDLPEDTPPPSHHGPPVE